MREYLALVMLLVWFIGAVVLCVRGYTFTVVTLLALLSLVWLGS